MHGALRDHVAFGLKVDHIDTRRHGLGPRNVADDVAHGLAARVASSLPDRRE